MNAMKHILVIEDDLSIAELERDYLEISGFRVDLADNGETGLQMGLGTDYDLILLDLMLPKMDGFEICRQLRSRKNVPLLIVSAKKEDIDIIRGLGLGADDFITKPFSPGELVARVKAHLARYERLVGSGEEQADIQIRGLRIDPAARRTFVNGGEVNLTTKEFELLAYLMKHPNRVFSREALFERLWGLDANGDAATVTVHIRKLREKIEMDTSNPQYIETIWGAGYRFKV